jgi:hypothetical protein
MSMQVIDEDHYAPAVYYGPGVHVLTRQNRGRRNIQITRTKQPSKKRFTVRRISGSGNLWVSEYILTYDGKPSYTVSIMEFNGDKVARETQYFADPFEASAWRAQWVERMDA